MRGSEVTTILVCRQGSRCYSQGKGRRTDTKGKRSSIHTLLYSQDHRLVGSYFSRIHTRSSARTSRYKECIPSQALHSFFVVDIGCGLRPEPFQCFLNSVVRTTICRCLHFPDVCRVGWWYRWASTPADEERKPATSTGSYQRCKEYQWILLHNNQHGPLDF